MRDDTFGNHGETDTPFGTPAINGYITGIALSGNLLAVAGRLTDADGLAVVAARYFATGAPPPPPPPPAASTLGVDGITGTGAHVTGTVNANGTASQLVARVRHDARPTARKTALRWRSPARRTTSTSASRSPASAPARSTTRAS